MAVLSLSKSTAGIAQTTPDMAKTNSVATMVAPITDAVATVRAAASNALPAAMSAYSDFGLFGLVVAAVYGGYRWWKKRKGHGLYH